MSNTLRTGPGIRIQGEKAQFADEAIMRSQLVAGNRIRLEYAANWDIIIHALGEDLSTGLPVRMINGILTLNLFPHTLLKSTGYNHGNLFESSNYDADTRFHFGSAKFNQIVHNWRLSDKDAFTVHCKMMYPTQVGAARRYVPYIYPKIVGVDINTIAIHGCELGDLGIDHWAANSDTQLFNWGEYISDWSIRELTYHYTIVEKVPHPGGLL